MGCCRKQTRLKVIDSIFNLLPENTFNSLSIFNFVSLEVFNHFVTFNLFSSFNASIIIDSSVIKNYIIPIQASLSWPSVVEQSIKFPSTYVGNFTTAEMLISNPSDHPLVVQIVPLLHYPQPEGGLDLLSDRLIVDSFSLDLNGHSLFSLPDLKVIYYSLHDTLIRLKRGDVSIGNAKLIVKTNPVNFE